MRLSKKSRFIFLSALIISIAFPKYAPAQCTELNAAGCACPTPGATNCLLLPDIIAGKKSLNSTTGWSEYSQLISSIDRGLLRIDVATPNIGWGPMEISPTNDYVCGTDTLRNYFPAANFLCPDGSYPKRLIRQKLYNKVGNTFQFVYRDAGWMQFHPSHGHLHINDWGLYTIRLKDVSVADTLQWPVVSSGIKVSFCLIDLTSCSGSLGDCVDAGGNVLNNASFPNYGLAAGYNCGLARQGISVGRVDIYGQGLDESFVKIPYEACNGNYFVMTQIDPDNQFLEMREDNNWNAAQIPITKQHAANTGPYAYIFSKKGNIFCQGQTLDLEASGASNYLWSNGATTQKTTISLAGKYWVRATTPCGTTTSDTLTVMAAPVSSIPVLTKEDTVCIGQHANLYASGTNTQWYDAPVGGNLVNMGNNFYTGALGANTTFYVVDQPSLLTGTMGPVNTNFSNAGNSTVTKTNFLIFNAFLPFKLKTVTVNSTSAGNRIIQLRDLYNNLITEKQVTLTVGIQDVALDFFVPSGMNFQLGLSSSSPLAALYTSTTAAATIGFPFNLNSLGRIVGSSLGDQSYPFFYNWQIEGTPQSCNSGARKAVTAWIAPSPTLSISGLQPFYLHTHSGVPVTVAPPGGTLVADGMIGNTFYPRLAGIGQHDFIYTIRYGNCVTEKRESVTVNFDLAQMTDGFSIQLWNNPGRNQRLYLVTNQNSNATIVLYNGTGQKLQQKTVYAITGSNLFDLDFNYLSKGMYFIEVRMEGSGGKKMIRLLN